MSRRQRKAREKQRRHAESAASKRVRAATISGSLAATAAFGLATAAEPAGAVSFDAALVKDINASSSSFPYNFAPLGSALLFTAFDGPDNGTTSGRELWRSDGTGPGTALLKNIYPGGDSYPHYLTEVGGNLFFSAYDGPDNGTTNGRELWKSDGTGPGTQLVKDINPSDSSDPQYFTGLGSTVLFSAYDGPDNGTTSGRELWVSDGSGPGTQLVKDINAGGDSSPTYLSPLGSNLFFSAYDGPDNGTTNGQELWKSDGTDPGTQLVKDINASAGSQPEYMTALGSNLFFSAYDGPDNGTTSGRELWVSDGSGPGTHLVKDINPTGWSSPRSFTDVGGTLLFEAEDGTNGTELWRSDGTTGGTQLVKDIRPGSNGSIPYNLIDVGGTLFFSANDGTHGTELWRSDGTGGGTQLVKDIRPGATYGSNPSYFADVGGTLFFVAGDGFHGRELWASDGTEAGTQLVKDINPSSGSGPYDLTGLGGAVFFEANDGSNGYELWKAFAVPSPPPPAPSPTPTTPGAAPSFDLKAAINRCKKKFPKGPKRKKCIKKAKAKARAS